MEKYLLRRIQSIQNQLEQLKRLLERQVEGTPPRPTKLEGLLAGAEITDEEIEESKREVFRDDYMLDKER